LHSPAARLDRPLLALARPGRTPRDDRDTYQGQQKAGRREPWSPEPRRDERQWCAEHNHTHQLCAQGCNCVVDVSQGVIATDLYQTQTNSHRGTMNSNYPGCTNTSAGYTHQLLCLVFNRSHSRLLHTCHVPIGTVRTTQRVEQARHIPAPCVVEPLAHQNLAAPRHEPPVHSHSRCITEAFVQATTSLLQRKAE
jgi:hypothetical protein